MKRPGTPTYPKTVGPWELEPHYSRHVGAMTSEGLHEKADIAFQLALRDKQIAELQAELDDAYRNDHPITNAEMLRRARETVAFCEAIERPEQEPQGALAELVRVVSLGSVPGCRPFDDALAAIQRYACEHGRFKHECSECAPEPQGAPLLCTDTRRNPSGFCERCGLAH